ncbi:MAG TPA: tetratricopeptide repeat protein, partial [Haliangium sp.]|nr:tetratricopeptide repeat protein [Haliangium sp.]
MTAFTSPARPPALLLRALPAAVILVASLAMADHAVASVESGNRKFLHGDYAGARADLGKVTGADRTVAQLALARVEMRVGAYDAAEKRARALIQRPGAQSGQTAAKLTADARVLLAELMRLTGRYDEARRELEAVVWPAGAAGAGAAGAGAAPGDHLRARHVLGLVYRDLGRKADADALWETFFTDWNSNKIDEKNAEALMYVAQAARFRAAFQEANDVFREAVGVAPSLLEANLEWGYMGLEKYAVGLAEQSFDEVLKIDPNHPDAHSGMALVKLEQSYDLAAALDHLTKALASNPRHVPALLVRASLEIDQNQWDAAKATLAEAFAVNPMSFQGRALLATVHWLRDDQGAYEAERKRVLSAN